MIRTLAVGPSAGIHWLVLQAQRFVQEAEGCVGFVLALVILVAAVGWALLWNDAFWDVGWAGTARSIFWKDWNSLSVPLAPSAMRNIISRTALAGVATNEVYAACTLSGSLATLVWRLLAFVNVNADAVHVGLEAILTDALVAANRVLTALSAAIAHSSQSTFIDILTAFTGRGKAFVTVAHFLL